MSVFTTRQRGYSLIELSVGLSIAILLGMFVHKIVQNATEVDGYIKSADVISQLETRIHIAVNQPGFNAVSGALGISSGNDLLHECLTKDKKLCPKQPKNFTLHLFKHQAISGTFSKNGGTCNSSCPIQIKTKFHGRCNRKRCDVAQLIRVTYDIYIEGSIVRSGIVNRINKIKKISDLNNSCGVDPNKLPKFVESIDGKKLNCGAVQPVQPKLSGLKAKSCIKGKQVFVGVNPKSKRIICETIHFKK